MAEAVLRGRAMTARTATAVHVHVAQRVAAVPAALVIPRGAVDGDALVLHVRYLDMVEQVVLAKNLDAVADPAPTAIDHQVADRRARGPGAEFKPRRHSIRRSDNDRCPCCPLNGDIARNMQIVLCICASLDAKAIPALKTTDALSNAATGRV